jgi:hypothetical protein
MQLPVFAVFEKETNEVRSSYFLLLQDWPHIP